MANPLERLIHSFSKLPGVGEKTAGRYALHVLRASEAYARELAEALVAVKRGMRQCGCCQAPAPADPCAICSDTHRDAGRICVVEEVADLRAIENTGVFRGRYHILHGRLSPLEGIGPEQLRVDALLARLRACAPQEVILATNPTVEGEATATYLSQLIRPLGVPLSRLASGIPLGAEVEYIDTRTLAMAITERRPM